MRISSVIALSLAAVPSSFSQECASLCADGGEPGNPSALFPLPGVGLLNCILAASIIDSDGLLLSPNECTMGQAKGFLICGCATAPPPNTNLPCAFCPDGSLPTNLNATIAPPIVISSTGGNITTCEGLVALASTLENAKADAEACATLQSNFSEICGCTAVDTTVDTTDRDTSTMTTTTTTSCKNPLPSICVPGNPELECCPGFECVGGSCEHIPTTTKAGFTASTPATTTAKMTTTMTMELPTNTTTMDVLSTSTLNTTNTAQPPLEPEMLDSVEEAANAMEFFNEYLSEYFWGKGLPSLRRRLQLINLLVRAALLVKQALGKTGPVINLLIERVLLQSKEDQSLIISEFGKLNKRLDDLEFLVKEGFGNIAKKDGNIKLDDFLYLVAGIETRFKEFTTSNDLGEDLRQKYRERLRQSCNEPFHLPSDIFRFFYGHACSSCDAVQGGARAASYFLETYLDAADSALDFRQEFGVIMMSSLARALVLHTVCLPANGDSFHNDTIWAAQLEDMTEALEEVAANLQTAELFLNPRNRGTFPWLV